MGTKHSKEFPEPSASGNRDAFATFGGSHILSLLTEVATRFLKIVMLRESCWTQNAIQLSLCLILMAQDSLKIRRINDSG